jgi:heme A synthase
VPRTGVDRSIVRSYWAAGRANMELVHVAVGLTAAAGRRRQKRRRSRRRAALVLVLVLVLAVGIMVLVVVLAVGIICMATNHHSLWTVVVSRRRHLLESGHRLAPDIWQWARERRA